MPWQAIDSPSLPVGLLRSACRESGLPTPTACHGGIRWSEFLLEATGGEISPRDYLEIAENGLFHSLGDWIFAGVLYDDEQFGTARLKHYAEQRDLDIELARTMRAHAEHFVDLIVTEILDADPGVVGFTTTFMQNVPSLAVAKLIKQRAPETAIVFGGGNCDGDMGVALHRQFRFVDYVIRGEGEVAFPELLKAIDENSQLGDIGGLCWWDEGRQRLNPRSPLLAADLIPRPDFSDWFSLLEESPIAGYVEPKLVVETARGCWWGEAHHCTFCGLNGTAMQFRAKSPENALAEISALVNEHQVLDVLVVDNIIDHHYFTSLLAALAREDWDLRIHYEVKSNLKPAEVKALRNAHVTHVQPGIESLVSPVLRIMDKGVSGVQNVRALRDLESAGLTISWNWLYGFPGEDYEHYRNVLVHLQPPSSVARILLERFSPYFTAPELGFARRVPAEAYQHVYSMPDADLSDLVYLFDTEPQGLGEDEVKTLADDVRWWTKHYPTSSLVRHEVDGVLLVHDNREGRLAAEYVIDDPRYVTAYRELEHGRSVPALTRTLLDEDVALSPRAIEAWLAELVDARLVFTEAGRFVALATSAIPLKVPT
jgi:ribosomal peptide maturation radical SAM protein 1